MTPRLPIGIDDFRTLREQGLVYVDKSHLLRELLDDPGAQVVLLPRPRRFGKTINLSMLRWFFEKRDEDLSHLFRDLSIWQAGDVYRVHFQRYPVIDLTLKGTKGADFPECWEAIQKKIQQLFGAHHYLLESGKLLSWEAQDFRAILDGTAGSASYRRALLDLSAFLHRHHGEKVVILLDEYDAPIHAGYMQGYAPEILEFMRAFFTEGLKGNPHLFRGVVTGVLRIAKESLFSDANNIGVFTLLTRRFASSFGFTETEVASLFARLGQEERLDVARAWYNGYVFGGEVIYNPWSVLCFLHREGERPAPYWLSTSSNDLVREALEKNALALEPVFASLLEGKSVERSLDESVVLDEIAENERALWSLLVFSGYLRASVLPSDDPDPEGPPTYLLSIPNREVRLVYAMTFRDWMKARVEKSGGSLEKLTRALLDGDAETFEEHLQAFVTNLLSYSDPGVLNPERVYQGFVLGLLAVMEPSYLVRSNRESGDGRPDVTIRPREPGKPGALLELKIARRGRKTPAAALNEALLQIRKKGYAAELTATGADPVHAFAVAFDGKRVWVKVAPKEKNGDSKKRPTTKTVRRASRKQPGGGKRPARAR